MSLISSVATQASMPITAAVTTNTPTAATPAQVAKSAGVDNDGDHDGGAPDIPAATATHGNSVNTYA